MAILQSWVARDSLKCSENITLQFVNEQNKEAPQVIYYDSGVGVEPSWLGKRFGGGRLSDLVLGRERSWLTM